MKFSLGQNLDLEANAFFYKKKLLFNYSAYFTWLVHLARTAIRNQTGMICPNTHIPLK